jgi:hypothetical protein
MREEIVSSFEHHLRAQGSPILDSVDAHEQMLDQVQSILDEVVDSYQGVTENIDLSAMSLSVEIGASQAIAGVRPAESLHAASVLFETALPFMSRAFSAIKRPNAEAALTLHLVIMSRIASSAVSYTAFMSRASATRIAPSWRGWPGTCTIMPPTP